MSGKINLSGKIQMGNGIIFFGEQTLAQDELRIKLTDSGVRNLSASGSELKLIIGNTTYNTWNAQAVAEANLYIGGDARDLADALVGVFLSNWNISSNYDVNTDLVGDTIIIKRKINNARLPAPSYMGMPDHPAYATTIITVNNGCTYQNMIGSDQSRSLEFFLNGISQSINLNPVGTNIEGIPDAVKGRTVGTAAAVAKNITYHINQGTTHTATQTDNVVTITSATPQTEAATTKTTPNPYTPYSNTGTYTGGTNFETYITGKELTFTPGASAYPITVHFIPPNPASPLWGLGSINSALDDHPFGGDRKADDEIVVLGSENGWTLKYNLFINESGTAAAPANGSVSTTYYRKPNETQYTITSFTDGAATPEIGHQDVLVRGLSPS